MKKFLLPIIISAAFVCALFAKSVIPFTLTPNSILVAANTTNTSAGTILELNEGIREARVAVSFTGIAATTNGFFKLWLSTAGGKEYVTNNFDTAEFSDIVLTHTNDVGAATVTISDEFNMSGVKYLRIGRMQNEFEGSISNISVKVGITRD